MTQTAHGLCYEAMGFLRKSDFRGPAEPGASIVFTARREAVDYADKVEFR